MNFSFMASVSVVLWALMSKLQWYSPLFTYRSFIFLRFMYNKLIHFKSLFPVTAVIPATFSEKDFFIEFFWHLFLGSMLINFFFFKSQCLYTLSWWLLFSKFKTGDVNSATLFFFSILFFYSKYFANNLELYLTGERINKLFILGNCTHQYKEWNSIVICWIKMSKNTKLPHL